MLRKMFLFAVCAAILCGQMAVPRIGFIKDRAGALRPVQGVTGSFFLGEAVESGVISAAFGSKLGFVKKETQLVVFRNGEQAETLEAPAGIALYYFNSDKTPNRVYFPTTEELWTVEGEGFRKEHLTQAPEPQERAESDEVVLPTGERIRLPEAIESVERIGPDWLSVRCPSATYAIQLAVAEPAVVQLPEVGQ